MVFCRVVHHKDKTISIEANSPLVCLAIQDEIGVLSAQHLFRFQECNGPVQSLVGHAQFAGKRFKTRGGSVLPRLAFGFNQVNDPFPDGLHAQPLKVQAKPSDLLVEHADPSAGELGVVL